MNNYIELAKRTESPVVPELLERLCEHARIMHAALGLFTEAGEFVANLGDHCVGIHEHNPLEEIGDLYWYAAIMADALGIQSIRIPSPTRMINYAREAGGTIIGKRGLKFGRLTFFELMDAAGNLVDVYKKHIFYGRPLPNQGELLDLFDAVTKQLAKLCAWAGYSVEDVLAANIRKLSARYPDKFKAEDAIDRDIDTEMQALSSPEQIAEELTAGSPDKGKLWLPGEGRESQPAGSCPSCHGVLKDSPNDPQYWRCVDCGEGVKKPD